VRAMTAIGRGSSSYDEITLHPIEGAAKQFILRSARFPVTLWSAYFLERNLDGSREIPLGQPYRGQR
jgi:hypothetical protein